MPATMTPDAAHALAYERLQCAEARRDALADALSLLSQLSDLDADANLEADDIAALNGAAGMWLAVKARLALARAAIPPLETAETSAARAVNEQEAGPADPPP